MGCINLSICRNTKVLRVVKVDGEVIEFTSPVVVGELLVKFEGFGVKSSRKPSKLLSPSSELRLGKIYYLFPLKSSDPAKNQTDDTSSSTRRIKIVIRKKQLEELLSKKLSVEKLISGIDRSCPNWKPSLITIPEEQEWT